MRPKILTLVDCFLPGYRGGGPVTSISNLVRQLGNDFRFQVVTCDRDKGTSQPYTNIPVNRWHIVEGIDVCHLSPDFLQEGRLLELLRNCEHDALYINSAFSWRFALQPLMWRRLGFLPRRPLVVAPRGEFCPGALKVKAHKKRMFLAGAKLSGLYNDIIWQSTSPQEKQDLERFLGRRIDIHLAPNLSRPPLDWSEIATARPKQPGLLRLLFASRICEKKNLLGALKLLKGLPGTIEFDIAGPLKDPLYWRRCNKLVEQLPSNVTVRYLGSLPPQEMPAQLRDHDLYFLPTWSENYGHVIIEALSAGCPVLISDRTPWTNIEAAGGGWDLPLDQPEQFREALRTCIALDQTQQLAMRRAAWEYALAQLASNGAAERNRAMFSAVTDGQQPRRKAA